MSYDTLVKLIQDSADSPFDIREAEKAGGTALAVMNALSAQLTDADRNRRMRKRGVKAIRSAVRMEEIKKHDKKPTESFLEDTVNLSKIVADQEEAFDDSEVSTEELERQFSIAKEAHLFFRGVARGRFE